MSDAMAHPLSTPERASTPKETSAPDEEKVKEQAEEPSAVQQEKPSSVSSPITKEPPVASKGDKIRHLPRTIQWKIQLDLWRLPKNDDWSLDALWKENKEFSDSHQIYVDKVWSQRLASTEEEEKEKADDKEEEEVVLDVDPLTAFAQEQNEPPKEEQHRPWNANPTNEDIHDIIQKDLSRLSPRLIFWKTTHVAPDGEKAFDMDPLQKALPKTDEEEVASVGSINIESTPSLERDERIQMLADILYCYAKEHDDVGYRQGMHEILAHIVLALELDREAHGEEGAFKTVPLATDAFILFQGWMKELERAYHDTSTREDTTSPSDDDGTTQMGERILTLLSFASPEVHGLLFKMSNDMGAPPQLYCAKWMRLLFGREIASRRLVLQFWDKLLNIVYDPWNELWNSPQLQTRINGAANTSVERVKSQLKLMDVLECAACSMILLQRKSLLSSSTKQSLSTKQPQYHAQQQQQLYECLSLLMNYPSLTKVEDLQTMTVRVTRFYLEHRLGMIAPKVKAKVIAPPTVTPTLPQMTPVPATVSIPQAVRNVPVAASPFLSRMGDFIDGAKTSAQTAMATMESKLAEHQKEAALRVKAPTVVKVDADDDQLRKKRQQQLQKLAHIMEVNVKVVKNHVLTPKDAEEGTTPENVVKAIEALEKAHRVLSLYGSKL